MPLVECGFPPPPGEEPPNTLIAHGPTLPVDIGFDENYDHTLAKPPVTEIQQVPALIDTGATFSCIDDALAAQLNLPVVDQATVGGIAGSHVANVYLAQVYVPKFEFTQYGVFLGAGLTEGGQQHQALLGRSFLAGFIMIYDGIRGQVTLGR